MSRRFNTRRCPTTLRHHPLALSISALLLGAVLSHQATAQPFPATFNLVSLDSSTGFRLEGAAEGDFSGRSVSAAGDINGDGIDDLIVGADSADPNGSNSGSGHVVFGRTTPFPAAFTLGSLDGSTGFRLDGVAAGDRAGFSVSAAGDINGDGIDDLIVGAYRADPSGGNSGSGYVVFGRTTAFPVAFALSSLDGSNGFRLDGVATNDYAGFAVSDAGDINGDGIDDLIISAVNADPNGSLSGSSYVVFGRATPFAAVFALSSLDGSTGFRLDGAAADDRAGRSVSAAGDINGDGIYDLIVGANGADPNNVSNSGSSYVVFGRTAPFAATFALDSVDGSSGFRLDGVSVNDNSGRSLSAAGDINGDGVDDLIIGTPSARPHGTLSGSSYAVFGRTTPFPAAFALSSLDGSNGFRLDGVTPVDLSGGSVSDAGDINGDGVDDLIIGAFNTGPNGYSSGSSYVVFGRTTPFAAVFALGSLDGSTGFRLDGVAANDNSGRSVSAAGDINGDGIDDLITGADRAGPNGNFSGSSYVVFGRDTSAFRDGFE